MSAPTPDEARVAAAVAAAEATNDGEIVVVTARQSDSYHDAALQWALLAAAIAGGLLAGFPWMVHGIYARLIDPWRPDAPPSGALIGLALIVALLVFLLARLLLADRRIRLALVPSATKARRVHARALMLFRVSVEGRTRASTGVLIYLSVAERRAEIVADAAINGLVSADRWGEAMAALVAGVRDGRVADGLVDAVGLVGAVIAPHFPRSPDDADELSNRMISL